MKTLTNKSDRIGALASLLCLLHCVATPFLFIAQSCAKSCCVEAPLWWKLIDFIFLMISFFAIKRACKTSTSTWIKPALWGSWTILTLLIINEHTLIVSIPELYKNIFALTLIVLHLYNLRFCQCQKEKCCANHG